jgi:hypothetical protein
MAVETRKQHIIRRLLTDEAYNDRESYLSALTLSELEEEWRHFDRRREDHIG